MVALDVPDHFSLSLESTGVISYKFSKVPEMSFHLVHSQFSVVSRLEVITNLVRISEARICYRVCLNALLKASTAMGFY